MSFSDIFYRFVSIGSGMYADVVFRGTLLSGPIIFGRNLVVARWPESELMVGAATVPDTLLVLISIGIVFIWAKNSVKSAQTPDVIKAKFEHIDEIGKNAGLNDEEMRTLRLKALYNYAKSFRFDGD